MASSDEIGEDDYESYKEVKPFMVLPVYEEVATFVFDIVGFALFSIVLPLMDSITDIMMTKDLFSIGHTNWAAANIVPLVFPPAVNLIHQSVKFISCKIKQKPFEGHFWSFILHLPFVQQLR